MKKLILMLSCVVFCGQHSTIHAVIKGSTTAVSIEPTFEFLSTDTDNKIQGFAWFKNGFTFENAQTQCDFASVYPVSGVINLNGGTLHLLEDLILKNMTILQGLGTIKGNNYFLEFCSTITALPENTEIFEDVYIALSNSLALQGNTTFAGFSVLDGRGHTVQLGEHGGIIVASNATLHLKDMIIKGIAADNIRCIDDTATLMLDNVQWVQSGDVTFECGSLSIKDLAEFYGNYAFVHASNQPITIGKQSLWTIMASIDLVIGKRLTADAVDPLVFEDTSSILKLSNCSLLVTHGGLHLKKGRLIFDEEVEIDMQSTNTTNGIIIGDGIDPANDFSIRFNSGVSVTHAGHTVYNNTSPYKLNALSKNAKLIREANSNIFMAQNVVLPSMTVESMLNSVPPIQGAEGVSITYQDDQVLFPAVAFDISGRQEKTSTFLLEGDNEIFFTKGSLPLNILVSGTNNLMHGNGGTSGFLMLKDHTTELICSLLGPISQSPILNGGKIILGADFVLGPDTTFVGFGIVDLTSCCVHSGAKDTVWTGTTTWRGSDGSIDMRAQISLTGMWRFEGQVTINGNDNTLNLGTLGSIVIASGSTLRCKNVRLTGISGDAIRCEDDSASLLLEDVIWVQDGNFTFSTGSLAIKDEVDFLGTYTFTYESKQTSTIHMKSEWHITDDMRFEIGKQPESDTWPLNFVDHTSVLHLDNCNYVITDSGMSITKGTIMYSRDVAIEIQSTDTTNGSFLGNGNQEDDPIVQFNPGAAARFLNGHMIWDVVDSNNLRSDSTTVQISRSGDNTYFIKQDLTLKKFTVSSDPSVKTLIQPGKQLAYDSCLFKLPNGQIAITGSRYNEYTSLLDGNDSIFLHYGTLPLVTYVRGIGNRIEGNGTVTGPIVLLDPSAVLNCNLRGALEGDLMLNGGTVNLEGGLMLADDAVIRTGGSMNVGSYSLDLPAKETVWTSTVLWGGTHANLNLNSKTSLSGQWIFTGDYTINGNGNVLDLSTGGTLVIHDGVTLILKDVRLSGIDNQSIIMAGDQSVLVLDSMTWVQQNNVTFDAGSIRFVGDVDFLGPHTFTYASAGTSTIALKSNWHVADGMHLVMGRKTADGGAPLYFEDSTSTLNLDNCNFYVTQFGLPLSRGRVLCSRDVVVDIASTSSLNGLHLGDGTTAGDMVFEFFPGCSVNFTNGHVVYDVTQSDSVKSRSSTARLIRDSDSVFDIQQHITLENLTIDASLYAITNVAPGISFDYSNCILELPTGSVIVNGKRYNAYTNLLTTGDSLFLVSGMMPMYTAILGGATNIIGNGSLTGGVTLLHDQAQLTLAIDGFVSKDVSLGGGTLVLGQDTHFACGTIIADSGTVDLKNFRLQLCSQDIEWLGTINWQSTGASIVLDSDLSLSGKWIIHDTCTIHGNGNVLDLSPGGTIEIAAGATLKLANVRVRGVSGTNMSCVDDTSKLILDQVVWVQDGDFRFEHGSMTFNDSVDFLGSYTFTYTSKKSSIINQKSIWHIANNMRFEIGKQPEHDAQNPLLFTDGTSTLHLDNCSFIVNAAGWDLLRGCIQYSRDVSIEVLSTSTLNGVSLGDGTPENDPLVLFDPGSNARFKKGHLNYNIVDPTKLRSDSSTVKMIRLAGSYFNIMQHITLKNFQIDASALAVTAVDAGKTFRYENCIFILPDGHAEVTAYRFNPLANVLIDNDIIFMRYGSMPMGTLVQGVGNKIAGTGDITGPILFMGPQGHLTCDLSGCLAGDVTLNGGTFALDSDLQLRDSAQFTTIGSVDLGSSELSLGSKDTVWTSTLFWSAQDASIQMNAKVSLQGSWTFNGNCTLDGNGNVFDLGKIGKLLVGDGVTVTLRNMRLTGIVDSSLELLGDTSALVLDNVTWVQEGDFTLNRGSMLFKNTVDFNGACTFALDTISTSTIAVNSVWNIGNSMQLSLGRKTIGSEDPVYFEDSSSTLCLNNCIFDVTQHGLWFTRGHVICNGDVSVDIHSTSTANGLHLGNGTVAGNMVFEFNPGSNVSFLSGHAVYDVTVPDSVLSRSTVAKLTRAAGSTFYVNQDITLENLTIDASLYAVTNVAQGKSFGYKNCTLNLPTGSIILNALRYNAYTNLLSGNESIFLAGANPMYTVVSGMDNYIIGNGSLTGQTILLGPDAQLILAVDGLVTQDIVLNGGTVALGQNLNFAMNKHFVADGVIALAGNQVLFGPHTSDWTSNLVWQGQGGQIDFNSDVALSKTWIFTGDMCVMHCHGNTLDLSNGGEIVVSNDTILHIKDAQIKGIRGSNIRCLASSSKLILENVTWVQEDDYQFTAGSIEWKHENEMCGNAIFWYQTLETSTIAERSCLCLDSHFNFTYDPAVTGTLFVPQDLIAFEDGTAVLALKGATFCAVHGIEFTKGSIAIQKNSELMSSTTDQGITLGTGNAADDCKINLNGGVQLRFTQGALNYKNVDISSWNSGNNLSMLYLTDNTMLNLYESLDVGMGGLLFGNNTMLNRAVGMDITGALTVQGELVFGSL